jgi:hypothetical protein
MVKSKLMRWRGHVACMGRYMYEMHAKLGLENRKGSDHLEGLRTERRTILKWIFRK